MINDKIWLEKVHIAYKEYPYKAENILDFVNWLYKQYGIIAPEPKK